MVSIIVAVSKNGVIGGNDGLLWHLPKDLKRFKDLTRGKAIIMGRKTYESIGYPLPSRTNIVVTKNTEYKNDGVIIYNDLNDAISKSKDISDEVMVIGGDAIYRQSLDVVDKIYLTLVDSEFSGDSYFEFDESKFNLVSSEFIRMDSKNPYDMYFKEFIRKT